MSTSKNIEISKTIDPQKFEKKIRIALLSSFSINGLSETLTTKCAQSKIGCFNYVGKYNQYSQEILNKSSDLYKFKPDMTFLILDPQKILGDIYFSPYSKTTIEKKKFITNLLNNFYSLIKQFTEYSNSKLVITTLNAQNYSPYGIFELKTTYGIFEMINEFNYKLINHLKDKPLVFALDFNSFVAKFGQKNIFDFRQYYFGDIQISLPMLEKFSDELIGFIKPVMGLTRKCLVLDLDNTLWGGIVGEDGLEGLILGPNGVGMAFMDFQRRLLSLQQRGIMLAINSKNNFNDAIEVIKEHPHMILRENHFACMKINWNDKVSNMKEIAEELNIGLDSIVFFDDDPVNQEFVKKILPEINTINLPKDASLYCKILMDLNDFNVLKITTEDKTRGEMYVQQKNRNILSKSTSNLNEFLSELNTKIKIKMANKFTIPRISQLTLKTNQFNLTTKRYQEEEIRNISNNENMFVGCAQVEDKFGDNGITGVFIIDKSNSSEWFIDTFLLSCRVMGRKVEEALFAHIVKMAKNENIKEIKANYFPTQKNQPAESFLPSLGFVKDDKCWKYIIGNTIKTPDFIQISIE
jgi:FkbH-like protein